MGGGKGNGCQGSTSLFHSTPRRHCGRGVVEGGSDQEARQEPLLSHCYDAYRSAWKKSVRWEGGCAGGAVPDLALG